MFSKTWLCMIIYMVIISYVYSTIPCNNILPLLYHFIRIFVYSTLYLKSTYISIYLSISTHCAKISCHHLLYNQYNTCTYKRTSIFVRSYMYILTYENAKLVSLKTLSHLIHFKGSSSLRTFYFINSVKGS